MSNLDELFKEKLIDHSITPSPQAWQKVEAGLSKRNRPVIWLRWAAVFLLGGLLLSSMWLLRDDVPVPVASTNPLLPQKNEVEVSKPAQPNLSQEKTEINSIASQKKKSARPFRQPLEQESLLPVEVTALQKEAPVTQPPETLTESTKVPTSIVLTYTLDPVETSAETILQPAVAATADKKDSSMKRVIEFASTVKNSESSPLENLRGMKEQLFALDLKKKTTSKKQ